MVKVDGISNDKLKEKSLLRPLGLLEDNFRARSITKQYNNFLISGLYNKEINQVLLSKVLRKILLKYSILTTQIFYDDKDEDNEPFLKPLKKIHFKKIVEFQNTNDLNERINEEMLIELEKKKFELNDENEPLFRIIIFNKKEVIFYCEHVYMDGDSGANFHHVFLETLQQVSNEDENDKENEVIEVLFDLEKDIDKLKPLPLPIESILTYQPTFSFNIKKLIKNYTPLFIKKFINVNELDHLYENDNIKTNLNLRKWKGISLSSQETPINLKIMNFSNDEIKIILNKCREHNVTITPFLQVIILSTLIDLKILKINDNDKVKLYFKSMIPINTRKFLNDDDIKFKKNDYDWVFGAILYIGSYCYDLIADFYLKKIDNKKIEINWDLIIKTHLNLLKTSNDKQSLMNVGYSFKGLESFKSKDDSFINDLGKSRPDSFRISNLGIRNFKQVNIENENKNDKFEWNVEDLIFSQSIGSKGSNIVANVISTKKGGMNIVFSCLKGVLDDKSEMNDFIDTLRYNIMNVV